MRIDGHCPQCEEIIPQSGFATGHAVCSCGWFDDTIARKALKKAERKTIATLIGASLLMAGLFIHFATFGSHAISLPMLKAQEMFGSLSSAGYSELADQCLALGHTNCAAEAYLAQYQQKRDIQGLVRLAKLNLRLGKSDAAAKAYMVYFQAGGDDAESNYLYGKLLEAKGDNEVAMRMYESAAAKSVETLPVLSTSAIVHLLMKQGRFEEAYTRLIEFHDIGDQAKGYMNLELEQLEASLGPKAKKLRKSSEKRIAKS